MSEIKKLFLVWLPPFLWMGFIFWLSSIPNLELKGELNVFDFLFRKLAHILEYAVLFLLWYRVLENSQYNVLIHVDAFKFALWGAFLISVLYGISDEVHQGLVPTRDGKMVDVLVDGVGVFLGSLIVILKKRRAPVEAR